MNSRAISVLTLLLGSLCAHAQTYTATYNPNSLPAITETDQIGTNQCGTGNNQTSLCQNMYVNNVQDFCLWGPQVAGSVIGNVEQIVIAYCTHPNRGTRLFPEGTLKSAHFVETPDYIQITGSGNFQNINIAAGDAGGELDPHGADGFGNPHGGLVFSNVWNNGTNGLGEQIHEWTNFMSVGDYCIRVCKETGTKKEAYCQHIYDVTGCAWNMPGDYTDGFTSCKGESGIPMGLYPQADGTTSTFHQGEGATPAAHPAPSVSACQTYQSTALYAATAFATPTTTVASGTGASTRTGAATATGQANGAVSVNIGSATLCILATGILGVVMGFSVVL
jgi:hypothetical protein